MKIHRFFVPEVELAQDFWFKDKSLLHQWTKVLRFRPGQQIVLFDGTTHDRLYEITEISNDEAHLMHITDYERKLPSRNIYLFWSLLKKDKNDWVLQKCTELGVSHFIPLIADRSEKTGFNADRAKRIVIEAAEQCGRSDIPTVRASMHVMKAIEQYGQKISILVCEQGDDNEPVDQENIGILIGPEGGWSDAEKQLFRDHNLAHMSLHNFTLRAETAAVSVISRLA